MSRVRYFRCYFLGYNRIVEILVLDFSLHPMCFSIQYVWLGSCAGSGFASGIMGGRPHRLVSVLDSCAEGPGFKSQLQCCRVTVLGKLFTPIVPLFIKQRNW